MREGRVSEREVKLNRQEIEMAGKRRNYRITENFLLMCEKKKMRRVLMEKVTQGRSHRKGEGGKE